VSEDKSKFAGVFVTRSVRASLQTVEKKETTPKPAAEAGTPPAASGEAPKPAVAPDAKK
jgi:hypothetical protein